MSGVARVALGQPGWRAADLILAATRLPGGDNPFHRGDEYASGAGQGESDDGFSEFRQIMGIDPLSDPFTLSPAEVRQLLGPVDSRRAELLSQLGGAGTVDILKQINVRVQDVGDERRVTVTMPPGMSFAEIFKAINAVPGRKQDGILRQSSLVVGPLDDKVSVGEQSFTIHFGSNYKNRDEQAAYLRDKGQGFSDPWVVAMAEAAQLAQRGLQGSLLRNQGRDYWLRTEKSKNTKGSLVWALHSGAHGVYARLFSFDDLRYDDPIAVGSSNL